ncbi:T9SS type B sorting domain-containing protein [Pedobacter arcticus]|uniref:T9SS type B sorting domain-containing protein n=1 Tax=Pedobacter arcticus TaxID=752140 RepID=UPI00031A8D37|nr:gliding motility-associated C-terminal domain-containing protein [Pedobacter arcticus]
MKLKPIPNLCLLALLLLFTSWASAQTNLPYFQSFKNATAPDIQFGGIPTAALTASPAVNIDPDGSGYLRLTNNSQDQRGYIYSTETFDTDQGLNISFEYYTYGGSGADGICFFLFDATAAGSFNIGGFGGSLGYAQYLPYGPGQSVLPGVSKGYLGVALDEYGNFPYAREGRQGGLTSPSDPYKVTKKSVVLRGKGDGNATDPNNYRFLTSVVASDKGVDLVNDANERFPVSSELGYRKAFIDLKPNPLGGYNVSVRIQVGGSPAKTTTVIDNYYYPDAPPTKVSYGISSSTGLYTNFHEIRNVAINVFEKPLTNPIALDDELTDCLGKKLTINVVANDASTNAGGVIDNSSIDLDPVLAGVQKIVAVPNKGTFEALANGTVTFTPINPNVTGPVTIKYTVADNLGTQSLPATITLLDPVTTIPSNAGTNQLISISTSTGSATIVGNSPAGFSGQWVQTSGPTIANIASTTSASTNVTNLGLGTYVFNWNLTLPGQCLSTDAVSILINAIPVAVDDTAVGKVNTPSLIDVLNNDTDRDGNTTLDKTTVVIKTQPTHGTATVNPTTGVVTYVPTTGYAGPDSFTYTVKDNKGAESNVAVVNIAVPIPPKVGLAKSLISLDEQVDGSYNAKFLFTIVNYGNILLQNLSLKDDLLATFNTTAYNVISLSSLDLTVNTSYNGNPDTELLAVNSQLTANQKAKVELLVNVKADKGIFRFENTAFVEGISSIDGTVTRDQSTDGLVPDPNNPGDVTPNVPTPIVVITDKIFIPEGFSPNGDGDHDTFVITNAGLTPLVLEVFNRWGNVVYKSNNYLNNWDGRSNKGLTIGNDLPVGTYYYVVNYNSKKYVGFITLNR